MSVIGPLSQRKWPPANPARFILGAAATFRDACLKRDGSLFAPGSLWTKANFEKLKVAFVDHPLNGADKFLDKLMRQLEDAGPEVQQLAAECLWVLLLFVHRRKFSPDKKKSNIGAVWALSGGSFDPSSPLLSDRVLSGVGSPGTAFLTRMPDELEFLVRAMLAWKSMSDDERGLLLTPDDPWRFCAWLTTQAGGDRRIFRHLLLFLLYPDHFERIASKTAKAKIFQLFTARLNDKLGQPPEDPSPCEIDATLLKIRFALEAEAQTRELDFYRQPLKDIWDPPNVEDDTGEEVEELLATPPRYWIEKTIVRGRPDRLEGPNALGQALWSPQRSVSGADIYKSMREVRPGDVVFHLTDNEAITAVSLVESSADESFVGVVNTDWAGQPAYRISLVEHELLTPPLERKHFFDTEPFARRIRNLIGKGEGRYFFNRKLELNQGAYLTEASPDLIRILDDAYWAVAGQRLPMVSLEPSDGLIDDLPDEEFDAAVLRQGLFLEDDEIENILLTWRAKKNLILQGPPGVGKTFAADRLAKLLIRSNSAERIGFVQFHQSYSYEDFVSGYRPNSAGGFDLKDGKFVQFCRRAASDPHNSYVYIIDEINRGNLSKIFGELMMLIEADKRKSKWSVPLAYGGDPFFVPENVFVLGLMNTADRSLSVVDFALRRRFTFIDLVSKVGTAPFLEELRANGIEASTVKLVCDRIDTLNSEISGDTSNLGAGFEVGHSYFCSPLGLDESSQNWYARIIRTEILPLLAEYWFDDRSRLEAWRDRLLGI